MGHRFFPAVAAAVLAVTMPVFAAQPAGSVDRSLPWVTEQVAAPRVAFRTFESEAAAVLTALAATDGEFYRRALAAPAAPNRLGDAEAAPAAAR